VIGVSREIHGASLNPVALVTGGGGAGTAAGVVVACVLGCGACL